MKKYRMNKLMNLVMDIYPVIAVCCVVSYLDGICKSILKKCSAKQDYSDFNGRNNDKETAINAKSSRLRFQNKEDANGNNTRVHHLIVIVTKTKTQLHHSN